MDWVTGLGYLRLRAPNLVAWRDLAAAVGMQEGVPDDGAHGERLLLRMDARAWRIEVVPDPGAGVAAVGWEVEDMRALDRLAATLAGGGVAVSEVPEEEAAALGVGAIVRCLDPAGFRLEFFAGARAAATPFSSPAGVRFVTGDCGMGHVFASVGDLAAAADFYEHILGFRLSDTIARRTAVQASRFYHVNPRHHSLALAAAASAGHSEIGHLMVEVEDAQSVVDVYDDIIARGVPVRATPGKHTNDHMFSFYVTTPSGLALEYGCNGRRIENDATWEVCAYTAASRWGHTPP